MWTTILRDVPYFDDRTFVMVRNRQVPIKPQQIVVWVSLAEIEQGTSYPARLVFRPFWIRVSRTTSAFERNTSYNGPVMQSGYFRKIADVRVNNLAASLHQADIWLHRNQPGKRDEMRDDRPFCLELNQGIVVSRRGRPMPHASRCWAFAG